MDIAQAEDLEMEGSPLIFLSLLSHTLHSSLLYIGSSNTFLSFLRTPLPHAHHIFTNFSPGACGGSCACSTCHVIVDDPAKFDAMPEPSDDENDMLDLAFGLTETSRLGCQVKMSKEIDGLRVRLPSMTRNLQAADFKGAKKE